MSDEQRSQAGSPARELGDEFLIRDTRVQFTKRLREGVRRGRIRCSIRIWTRPHVRVGGRYPMDEGEVEVQSIEPIELDDITHDLARESGFDSIDDLLAIARHGQGRNVYLIRFRYLPAPFARGARA